MASRRRGTTAYSTFGSVAYAPAYDGSAVRAPRREEEAYRRPRPEEQEHLSQQELTRTQVQTREAGQVAPFAVVGFLAVAVFAVLLLLSYVQFTVLSDEMVTLRSQLTALETESATLSAQYEKVFDMETLEKAVGDTMVRPSGEQVVYLDLSRPDTVTVYTAQNSGMLDRAWSGARQTVGEILEYFR